MDLRGTDLVRRSIRSLPSRLLKAVTGSLVEEMEKTMTAAKRLTPVDDGTLRASGHVQKPVIRGSLVTITMGFGGPAGSGPHKEDVGYAVRVHEQTDVFGLTPGGGTRNHSKRAFRGRGRRRRRRKFVGQAKYLETAIDARRSDRARNIAAGVRRRLRGRRARRR